MTRDVVLVTVECARWDYRDALDLPDRLSTGHAITAGHYTRPSMAGILTGQWESVVATEARRPTLANVLSRAGYETRAICYSPQTTQSFGFNRGFNHPDLLEPDSGRLARGSRLRERLGESRVVRFLKRYARDKHATFANIPRDAQAVDRATNALTDSRDRPLFLWVHLMRPHRPYGWSDALPPQISRAAAEGHTRVGDTVEEYYTDALRRAGNHVWQILESARDDSVVVVAGDHGEELGEDGIFFHGGFRRRVNDRLVSVPIATRNVRLSSRMSLIDVPAYICHAVDVDRPAEWDARLDRDYALTIAPWNDSATVRYQSDGVDFTFEDAARPAVARSTVGPDTNAQLRALGYADVG